MLNYNKQDYRAGKVERMCWAEGVECFPIKGSWSQIARRLQVGKKLRESIKRKDKLPGKVYEAKTVFCWHIKPSQKPFQQAQESSEK